MLDALHQRRHAIRLQRDIKPHNAMLDRHGRAVLIDWGVSAPRFGRPPIGMAGTPPFKAPEVLSGSPHTVASDLHSLGAVLYFLVCGAVTALAHSLDELCTADAAGPALHLNEIRPRLPARFASAVAATLSSVPAQRPVSAIDLAQALGSTR